MIHKKQYGFIKNIRVLPMYSIHHLNQQFNKYVNENNNLNDIFNYQNYNYFGYCHIKFQ